MSFGKVVKKTFQWIGILILVGMLILLIFLSILYIRYSIDFDQVKPVSRATSNIFYDAKGEIIYQSFGTTDPKWIKLQDIPNNLKNATLVAEDVDFYKHSAFSIRGMARAIIRNYGSSTKPGFGRIVDMFSPSVVREGGSTITQQLAKNMYLSPDRNIWRKYKELVFAIKLEKKYSKDQILEMYLNQIYYGEQSLGVDMASQVYFGKEVKNLDLAECAILAAIPVRPTYYSPISGNQEAAEKRQIYILDKMAKNNFITEDAALKAKSEQINYTGKRDYILKAPYFVAYVKNELSKLLGEKIVQKGGLKVYTTLDMEKQNRAEEIVKKYVVKFANQNVDNAAIVAIDPKNGHILAMVGGADWNDPKVGKVNIATSLRQPGSSFKPLVYAAGLEKGYTPATLFLDAPINFGGNPAYIPKNYDSSFRGIMNMRDALANSINLPAVEMTKMVGVDEVINQAKKFGINTFNSQTNYGLSVGIGSAEVKLVEFTDAFAALANGGRYYPPAGITKVIDNTGRTIYLARETYHQAVSQETAFLISSILSDNKARSKIFGLRSPLFIPDRTVAAKTGTTNNYKDAWTMGYTPSIAVGVWIGNTLNEPMRKLPGVEGAAYLWNEFMVNTLTQDEPFAIPADIVQKYVNKSNGTLASYQTSYQEYFNKNNLPPENYKDAKDHLTWFYQHSYQIEEQCAEGPDGDECRAKKEEEKAKKEAEQNQ